MIKVGVTLAICFMLSALATANPADEDEKMIRISEPWFESHGCPKQGSFIRDCNICYCNEAGSTQNGICTRMMCFTQVIDNFYAGENSCEPNQYFYSSCKYCKCNEDGTDVAECDSSACQYYGLDDGQITTTMNSANLEE